MIGGGIMLFVLGFPVLRSLTSEGTIVSTEPASNMPRLLALEATNVPLQRTPSPVQSTSIEQPNSTSVAITVNSTITPLALLHEQEPPIIGYSTQGRPLNVFTFGTGEHQRMIVADIHGG